jgi:hypothetical protein
VLAWAALPCSLAWQLSASHTRVRQRRSVAEAGDSVSEQQQAGQRRVLMEVRKERLTGGPQLIFKFKTESKSGP